MDATVQANVDIRLLFALKFSTFSCFRSLLPLFKSFSSPTVANFRLLVSFLFVCFLKRSPPLLFVVWLCIARVCHVSAVSCNFTTTTSCMTAKTSDFWVIMTCSITPPIHVIRWDVGKQRWSEVVFNSFHYTRGH